MSTMDDLAGCHHGRIVTKVAYHRILLFWAVLGARNYPRALVLTQISLSIRNVLAESFS